MESGKSKIQVDFAELIEEKFNIDGWWLLTGKGSMKPEAKEAAMVLRGDTLSMPLVSHTVQAGRGGDIGGIRYEVVETMAISKSLFKTPPASTVRIIKVDGYSMVPMLYPDSYCIFDEARLFTTDGLYIINYGNELMVKLLQQDPSGAIHIKSANPDYQSWTVSPSDQTYLRIIGKVLRIII
jgi:phage repressor protein C with HTH and peptisase S24 domain